MTTSIPTGRPRRTGWIDCARAIAMFLVVLGHMTALPAAAKAWIYAFHMPVFFMLPGLLCDPAKPAARPTPARLTAQARRLMLPFVIWNLVYALIYRKSAPGALAAILYGSRNSLGPGVGVSSLWFLPCLFLARLLFDALADALSRARAQRRPWLWLSLMLALGALGLYWNERRIPTRGWPWSANVALTACGLMILGHLLRPACLRLARRPVRVRLLAALAALALLTATFGLNRPLIAKHKVNMSLSAYGSPALFLLDAVCGFVLVCAAGQLVDALPVARLSAFVGRHTLGVLAVQLPLVRLAGRFLPAVGRRAFVSCCLAAAVITMIGCLLSLLLSRLCPWAVGQSRRRG